MRSLIVGEGYIAEAFAHELARSGVSIERARPGRDSELATLADSRRFDQVVVVPARGGASVERVVERVDGPRWLVCLCARGETGSLSPTAEAGRRAEVIALERGATVLQLSTVFGRAGDDTVTRLARFMRRYRIIVDADDGDRLVQPLHVDDLAAFVGCHISDPSSGRFEIAGAEALPVAELQQSVAEVVGVRLHLGRVLGPRGPWPRRKIDWGHEHAPVSINPARTRFGWSPLALGIRIEQGVHEALA